MGKCKYCQDEHNLRGFACRVCKNGLYRYKLTRNDQIAIHESQDKKCYLCEKPIDMFKGLSGGMIDHCHKTGKVRGILCHPCNTSIGYLEKNIKFNKLKNYLGVG